MVKLGLFPSHCHCILAMKIRFVFNGPYTHLPSHNSSFLPCSERTMIVHGQIMANLRLCDIPGHHSIPPGGTAQLPHFSRPLFRLRPGIKSTTWKSENRVISQNCHLNRANDGQIDEPRDCGVPYVQTHLLHWRFSPQIWWYKVSHFIVI